MIEARVAVVTGAAGALGGSVVEHFAATNMKVVAVSGRTAPSDLPQKRDVVAVSADLLNLADAEAVMQRAVDSFGRIDALVCLAGGFFGDLPVAETPPERLREQFELNVITAYTCVRAVLRTCLLLTEEQLSASGRDRRCSPLLARLPTRSRSSAW